MSKKTKRATSKKIKRATSKKAKSGRVILSKTIPHQSATKFRGLYHPTLMNIEDEWLAYDESGAYLSIRDKTMRAEISLFLVKAVRRQPERNEETGETHMALVPFNPKRADIAEVYEALEMLCHRPLEAYTPPCWLDKRERPDPQNIIACQNGLLDISTRELHGHTPDFFTRTALPIRFEAQPPAPERWLQFLKEVTADRQALIDLLQEMLGYLISTDLEQEQVFYFLGKSRGGKGTLMKVIHALVGKRNLCAPTIRTLAGQYWAWPLREKSVAMITDMTVSDREKTKTAANHINAISGRDPVTMERKFKEPVDAYCLPTRIVMAGNTLPDFGEHVTALANRLLVIPFEVSFKGREDRQLAAKLIRDELPGILVWALEGLARLRERGHFVEPPESVKIKDELLRLANPVRSFLDERCIIRADLAASKVSLYNSYKTYCEEVGVRPIALKDFAQRIYELVPGSREYRPRADGKQVPHFAGVATVRNAQATAPFDFEKELDSYLNLGFDLEEAIANTRAEAQKLRAMH